MSKIEDAEKLVGILEKLKEFVSGNKLYKVLSLLVLVSAILFLIGFFPAVRSILDPMYTTLRMIFAWIVVLGIATTSSLWVVDKCETLLQAKKRRREESEAQEVEAHAIAEAKLEHERKAMRERERIADLISGMSEAERKIFSLVEAGNGCGVWVALEDSRVQTLIHRGLLGRIGLLATWQYWEESEDGRALCILVEIPSKIRAAMP